MKIVIATPFYPPHPGVLAMYAEGLEGALTKAGHEVRVVSLGALKRLPPGVRHVAYAIRFAMVCAGADRALILDTWSVGVPASFVARILRVPYRVRIGGDFLWEHYLERTGEKILLSEFYTKARALSLKERVIHSLTRSLVLHAEQVFFNTRFQKEIWAKPYGLSESARVLENMYPQKRDFTSSVGKVFVSAHRKSLHKNEALLERVFARVKERHPEIELDTRPLPREEHLLRMAESYALVIPSISEVGSNMAIEAVASGKPFIMSSDTGTKERMAECGMFIDARSEEALLRAIESMLDADTYATYLERIRAFSFVRSWETIARDVLLHI